MLDTTGFAEPPFVLLLGLDLEDQESSGYAFEQAVRITSRIRSCVMHILHVAPEGADPDELRRLSGLLELYVSGSAGALGMRAGDGLGLHVRRGDAAREIAQLAADAKADMIVVGAGRHALRSLFAATTASHVMAATHCPVFVAGPRPAPEPSHVIVIEGPCPDCVATREATRSKQWWCARHAEPHHLKGHHLYTYSNDWPFAEHDSEVTATGTD